MTWLQVITQVIRDYILNSLVGSTVQDLANNGLTPADEAVIDAYLAQPSA
jgi:hypothetical protein